MNYTIEEIEFVKSNYPLYGPKFCGLKLNRTSEAVGALAKRLNIKKNNFNKHPSMQNINPEQFWKITKPEIAYFLGYFWADGYITYYKNKNCNNYKISLEIQSEDANDVLIHLNKLGKWNLQTRKRKENWKETTTINTNSKDIYNFLYENDYDTKSESEPTKILSKIPEHLKVYFWRGFFDGDGSIWIGNGKNKRFKSIQFSSTFNYKWIELINLLNSLNIKEFNIHNKIDKNKHTGCKLIIFRKESIKNLINYLLQSKIGLIRKTNKMQEFLLNFN